MHEYRVIEVTGDSPSTLEFRLNEAVDSGWLLDKITHDGEGKPRWIVMMRVRASDPAREKRPS